MKQIIIILCISLMIGSCKRETNNYCVSYGLNDTEHSISVRAFLQGSIDQYASFELAPHEKKEINHNGGWGKGGEVKTKLLFFVTHVGGK